MVRNCEGKLILTATKRMLATTPKMAEALAMRFGLNIARRYGYNRNLLEGDALNIVNAVKNRTQGPSPIQMVLDGIRIAISYFAYFNWSY